MRPNSFLEFFKLLQETEPITEAYDLEWQGPYFIPVGPHYGQLSLAELQTNRPEALTHIRWDPIPEILPITQEQRRRVKYILQSGSPAGWK
jgi:hypothetical protein